MKKFLLILLLLFFSLTPVSYAETRTIKVVGPVAISTSVVNYLIPEGSASSATESTRSRPLSSTGTFSNLQVLLSTAPDNGAGTQTVTVTLRLAGADKALTCTISETETTCNDVVNAVTGTAGQLVSFAVTPSGTPAASNVEISYQYTDLVRNYSWNIMGSGGNSDTSLSQYFAYGNNGSSSGAGAENNHEVPMPTSGTLKNLYCQVSVAPDNGAGTQSWTYTVRKNSAAPAGAPTCTISEGATTCNDTTNGFTFVAGDRITMEQVPANTPITSTLSCGITFQNNIEGEFIMVSGIDGNMSAASSEYRGIISSASWNATESSVNQLINAFTLKGMYVEINGSPDNGAGTDQYTFTIRDDGISTGHSCVISETDVACSDVDSGVAVAVNSQMSIIQTPANTPTARLGFMGILGYNTPTPVGQARALRFGTLLLLFGTLIIF